MYMLYAFVFLIGVSLASPDNLEFTAVSSGGYFTATALNNGSLWLWGIGSGTNGTRILGLPSVAQLACGGYGCLVLDNEGAVYTVDALRERLEDSEGKDAMFAIKVDLPQRVKRISTSFQHNIAIAEDGETVYSWGENVNGKLGPLDEKRYTEGDFVSPQAISFPLSDDQTKTVFVDACCGGEFTLLLDDAGRVWSFGINNNGQLGRESSAQCGEQKPRVAKNDAEYDPIPRPITQSLGATAYDFRTYPLPAIASMACGGDHTLLLAETGEVYSFGWGALGQLGHGVFEDAKIPTPIALPDLAENESVIEVAVGGYGHSILLTNKHRVFTFGWNENHQLGFEHAENLPVPTWVKPFAELNVLSIANNHGFRHSFFLVASEKSRTDGGLTQSDTNPTKNATSPERFLVVVGDNSYGQLKINLPAR